MIKKEELKYLQDYIKATMDLPEYEELRSIGGDALVFEEVRALLRMISAIMEPVLF